MRRELASCSNQPSISGAKLEPLRSKILAKIGHVIGAAQCTACNQGYLNVSNVCKRYLIDGDAKDILRLLMHHGRKLGTNGPDAAQGDLLIFWKVGPSIGYEELDHGRHQHD